MTRQKRPLDSRTTTMRIRFDLKFFFAYFQKMDTPESSTRNMVISNEGVKSSNI